MACECRVQCSNAEPVLNGCRQPTIFSALVAVVLWHIALRMGHAHFFLRRCDAADAMHSRPSDAAPISQTTPVGYRFRRHMHTHKVAAKADAAKWGPDAQVTLIVHSASSMLSGMALLHQILPCMTRPAEPRTVRGIFEAAPCTWDARRPFCPNT